MPLEVIPATKARHREEAPWLGVVSRRRPLAASKKVFRTSGGI